LSSAILRGQIQKTIPLSVLEGLKKEKEMYKAMTTFLFALLLFTGCKDDCDCGEPEETPAQGVAVLTVTIDNEAGGYEIFTAESGCYQDGSGGDLIETFQLPAMEAPGTAYRIIYDYADDYITPDVDEVTLVAGDHAKADGEYILAEQIVKLTIFCSISECEYSIYRLPEYNRVNGGPSTDDGTQKQTFSLKGGLDPPGICYDIAFSMVAGYDKPDTETVCLVVGDKPDDVEGEYAPN
jgi:hypothetical protein